jgi:transposase
MLAPVSDLPIDTPTLQSLVLGLMDTLQEKDRRIDQLSSQLEALKRHLFGRRSEKLDPGQLALDLGELSVAEVEAVEESAAEPVREGARRGHGRRRLPSDLPRQRVEYDVPECQRTCPECQQSRVRIGEEVSEQLEYVPASFFVREQVRLKYACPHCEGHVVIGSAPAQPIGKGLPGPGLLAHVLTSKYADHLPLNRLEGIFARHGVELSRSTMCDWVGAGAELLKPLVDVMKHQILASRKIHTDDTPVPVLDKDREVTRTGRLWVYLGDADHEGVVFDYTPDRSRDGPQRFLSGYKGYLQADAYPGYDEIYASQGVIEVACWAHARRKFFDAMKSDSRRSQTALGFIRRLYEVERQTRDLEPAARCARRQSESGPVLLQFKTWLDDQHASVAPKSPMGEAIGYARFQWIALTRYLEDGILAIDNNAAERALRRVAVGRKNWLFAGSDAGGRRAAIVYSLVASCARLKINPYDYLRDVLEQLPTCLPGALADLTPQAWKRSRAAARLA